MRKKIATCLNAFKNSLFLRGIFVLGFSGVLCKLIGMFYRIPLTNILGSGGMGVYGLVYPIYSLLLVVSSSALPLALSKIVAENVALKDYNYIRRLKKIALNLMLLIGGVLTLLLIIFSGQITNLQGVAEAKLAFIFIAPSILIVGLICVYRGIFQGLVEMKPTAISQLIEQCIKLVLGLILAILLLPFGVAYAVGGAMLAITISEAVALLYLIIKFNHLNKKQTKSGRQIANANIIAYENKLKNNNLVESESHLIKSENSGKINAKNKTITATKNAISTKASVTKNAKNGKSASVKQNVIEVKTTKILSNLVKVCVPITFSGLVIPLCLVIDSFLIVNVLVMFGTGANVALADYGLYSNVVNTLINVPIVLIGSLGAVTLPLIAKAILAKEPLKMRETVAKCINFTIFICVPCVLVFALLPTPILNVLYPALTGGEIETASRLLVISASTIFSLGVFYISTSVLQGAGKNKFCIINCCICSILRILIYVLLIKMYGIYAVAMAGAIMYFAMAIINVCYMIRCTGCGRLSIIKIFNFALIFICITLCIYLCLVGFMGCYAILIALLLGGLIYLLLNFKMLIKG